jgi:hypothetical protein
MDMYFPLLNFDFVTIVVNEIEEVVGVGVGIPDLSQALRKCKGKLFPFGWIHLLKALKANIEPARKTTHNMTAIIFKTLFFIKHH